MSGKFQQHTHMLTGCSPEPLLHYLKSLGILRLVARQKDKGVRGWWENGMFFLSTTLSEEELLEFFIDEYIPTPIIAPWNNRSGFYGDAALRILESIFYSEEERYREYIDVIAGSKDILAALGLEYGKKQQKKLKEVKTSLIERCRSEMPDSFVELMDVVLALSDDNPSFAPLMGSGGNDGNLEFTATHMGYLQQVIPVSKTDVDDKKYKQNRALNLSRLRSALFQPGAVKIEKGSSGQFLPGGSGGPNSSTNGHGGVNLVNPWDYILAMEGLFLFAGSVSRQLEHQMRGSSFPFTVRGTSAAGWGTVSTDDADKGSRGEIWLPLWKNPASLPEISYLFSEGRARVGQRTARNGVDFARAAASLGIDRGITSFQRIGFLSGSRSGNMFFASSLGLFPVTSRPTVRLLDETDWWVDRLRRECHSKGTPARYRNTLKNIEEAIFSYCRYGGPRRLQEIIMALGQASQDVALNGVMQKNMPPLTISPRWIIPLDDGSAGYRIAASVSSIHDYDGEGGSIRENLEPVAVDRSGRLAWEEKNYNVGITDLPRTLSAILEKRFLRKGTETSQLPLGSRFRAELADVRLFLDGKLEEKRILALLIGMSLIRWQYARKEDLPERAVTGRDEPYPVYALLKLVFLPGPLRWPPEAEPIHVKIDRAMLGRLRAEDFDSATRMALRRLAASGFALLVSPREAHFIVSPELKKRLAASMIIPVGGWSRLAGKILVEPELENQKMEGVVL